MADNYPQEPTIGSVFKEVEVIEKQPIGIFPTDIERARLDNYNYYKRLFLGEHFDAFALKIDDEKYNKAYAKLRYIAINFAGLLSKIMADMLFSEPIRVNVPDGDQEYIDKWWRANKMDIQLYESALGNSSLGDAVFKLRIGKLFETDEKSVIIAEDINPRIYFPIVDMFNVRGKPSKIELKWLFNHKGENYLRVEIHEPQKISHNVFKMRDNKIESEIDPKLVDLNLPKEEATGIDDLLLFHIPNWKTGDRYFGLSDYSDLTSLFYGLNNRMSAIDNILDKHSDPILMVPKGVINEKTGQVNKKALGVIEVESDADGKPEYIIWDASLESAFKEVEKLVDFLYLTAEISPDLLGMGEGVSESGRALKFKLMRTLAKVSRKKLYFDQAIKDLVYTVQLLAKEHNIEIDGKRFEGEPVRPEITWQDGLPIDMHEYLLDEIQAVDAGLTSKKQAIMRLYQVDEENADSLLKEVEDEKPEIELPSAGVNPNNPFAKKPEKKVE